MHATFTPRKCVQVPASASRWKRETSIVLENRLHVKTCVGFSERTKAGLLLPGSEGRPWRKVSMVTSLVDRQGVALTICNGETAALIKISNAHNLALAFHLGEAALAELSLLDELVGISRRKSVGP